MIVFTDTPFRQAGLSVLLAALIVTAGCAGFLSDEGGTNEPDTSAPVSAEDGEAKRTNGTDLRTVSVPENGSVTASGELDYGDPIEGNRFYEPVQIAAVEGQVVNVTMKAENGNPNLRVVDPEGNVTQAVSNEEGDRERFIEREFRQSGHYTFEATSADRNATFNYTLTIERVKENKELFRGDVDQWNETEQYLIFSQDMAGVVSDVYTQEYGSTHSAVELPEDANESGLKANATGDYVIYTYEMPSEYNFTQRNTVDVTATLGYVKGIDRYGEFGNNTDTPTNQSWAPEIVFFKAVDPESGELVSTTFITKEWALRYQEDGETDEAFSYYMGDYYSTLRYGPGRGGDNSERDDTIAPGEIPEAYYNYTNPRYNSTLAEKYGL
ncbi:hypothetical protein [Haloarcula laminariae]|uniref:hypothetical protein n=1 Tax=Haloarcula laminariae TaxID=2961577 RepID=UPI002405CCE8|nr:hypothetical protein [Halomicroarcula sp. FL173]